MHPLIDRIDAYCDAVPRSSARVEEHGALVLFVKEGGGWPFYARPRRGGPAPTAEEVRAVRARQRELGVPEQFEWIADVAPDMVDATAAAGLHAGDYPLMHLPGSGIPATSPPGVEIRLVDPDSDDLATISAIGRVAFSYPGTAVGSAGARALAETAAQHAADPTDTDSERRRLRRAVKAVALCDGEPVAAGTHTPVGDTTEIAGVGTLPAFRRRGIGRALTACLVADARARGVDTIFLTAGSDEIARTYAAVGFEQIGTAGIAEPATSAV